MYAAYRRCHAYDMGMMYSTWRTIAGVWPGARAANQQSSGRGRACGTHAVGPASRYEPSPRFWETGSGQLWIVCTSDGSLQNARHPADREGSARRHSPVHECWATPPMHVRYSSAEVWTQGSRPPTDRGASCCTRSPRLWGAVPGGGKTTGTLFEPL